MRGFLEINHSYRFTVSQDDRLVRQVVDWAEEIPDVARVYLGSLYPQQSLIGLRHLYIPACSQEARHIYYFKSLADSDLEGSILISFCPGTCKSYEFCEL